jgi:hypothetical protein
VPNGEFASESVRLTAALSVGKAQLPSLNVTLPHWIHRVLVSGVLRARSGHPIVGALLTIETRPPWGIRGLPRVVGTTTTNSTGHYAVVVSVGPSERVAIRYRAMSLDPGFAGTVWTSVGVRPEVALSAPDRIARGTLVTFRGSVNATGIPPRGVLVLVEAQQGNAWVTFATGRSDAQGFYRIGYTFFPGPVTSHRLRVIVPVQSAFPWAEGISRPANVLVY